MAADRQYTPNGAILNRERQENDEGNPSVPETWKSLGDLARALAERGRDAP